MYCVCVKMARNETMMRHIYLQLSWFSFFVSVVYVELMTHSVNLCQGININQRQFMSTHDRERAREGQGKHSDFIFLNYVCADTCARTKTHNGINLFLNQPFMRKRPCYLLYFKRFIDRITGTAFEYNYYLGECKKSHKQNTMTPVLLRNIAQVDCLICYKFFSRKNKNYDVLCAELMVLNSS